jgi:superfamily II DNA or RNA helicase
MTAKSTDLRAHQIEAAKAVVKEFKSADRALVNMACGTGKTLVGTEIARRLRPKRILIQAPTIALTAQLIECWLVEQPMAPMLCICSDVGVLSATDEWPVNLLDYGIPVTTDADAIRAWLQNNRECIVFATYQSVKKIAEALPRGFRFDLAIFDEAHRTAGEESKEFGLAIHDRHIGCSKRCFMTATPRVVRVRNSELSVMSMDDASFYGREVFSLSVARAIELGLIVDYKVIISAVTSKEAHDALQKLDGVKAGREIYVIDDMANLVALTKAIDETKASHVVSFHSRVDDAQNFASMVGGHLNTRRKFTPLHINGLMALNERRASLQEFASAKFALITNARCLAEGVNVPAIDMVAFLDPKRSNIDIVQIVGRALRPSPGKKRAYVFIPMLMGEHADEEIGAAAARRRLDFLWETLEALGSADPRFASELKNYGSKSYGRNIGEGKTAKLIAIGQPRILETLNSDITNIFVNGKRLSWCECLELARAFAQEFGHCIVPQRFSVNGYPLGVWVNTQRRHHSLGLLNETRVKLLEGVGMVWSGHESQWDANFAAVKSFFDEHGHYRPSRNHNAKLNHWVVGQVARYSRGELLPDRQKRLEEIGFFDESLSTQWRKQLHRLKQYVSIHGHSNVVPSEDSKLYGFAQTMRISFQRNELSEAQVSELNSIDFNWGTDTKFVLPKSENTNSRLTSARLARLTTHVREHGKESLRTCRDKSVSQLVTLLRRGKEAGELSTSEQEQLEQLGVVWNPYADKWQKMFERMEAFKKREGHTDPRKPRRGAVDLELLAWAQSNRQAFYMNILKKDRKAKLDAIGFIFRLRQKKNCVSAKPPK